MAKTANITAMSPKRGTVALLGVDERTTEMLRAHLKTGYKFEAFSSHEPLVSALGLGSLHVDVLLIGQDFEAPLDIALTVRRTLRSLQVIVLTELRDVEPLKKRAEIQSDNTDEVTIWPSQHLHALPDMVRRALKRAHRRVRRNEDSDGRNDATDHAAPEVGDHLTHLLERAPIGILTISKSGEVRTLNAQARDVLCVAAGGALDRPIYDFFPVFEQRKLRSLLRSDSADSDEAGADSANVLRVLGEERKFVEIIVAGDVEQLAEQCTMLILHDVTNIVRAEQAQQRTAAALQASEDRFNELADAMRMIPWEADPETLRITFMGDLVEDVMGYPPTRWLSKNFWIDRLHPHDRRSALERINRDTRRLQNFDHEFRMYDAEGRVRWLRNIVNVVRNDDGLPERVRGFIVDITESRSEPDSGAS